ncbi:hypothetical protein F9C07_3228 [Aspergillus flavus]|uniref:Uncharacterized protein n=1 Tax=Aspergillus flavus (strain ATCC 200026 / FGSC A1120 / IAM 13836 / NRRL 3357 / JCM 12722 / SRRC 167) TaxID=332952 RepID=A0A7U2MT82_ASPFN|nr:hypothetical protein F9C07_3228 [Aspergillus flavus]
MLGKCLFVLDDWDGGMRLTNRRWKQFKLVSSDSEDFLLKQRIDLDLNSKNAR